VAEGSWHRLELPQPETAPREMVWLHGWGLTGKSLAPLARLFAAKAATVVVDQPGFGATARLFDGAGSADYADALAAQLAKTDRPRILVGHSFGARVALYAATRHPDTVSALVFIAGAGLPGRRSLTFKLRAAVLRGLGRLAGLADRLFGSDLKSAYAARFGSPDYRRAGELRATFVNVVNEDLSDLARRVSVPVLLIYGEHDTETPPESGRRYAALIPDAELHVLEGFGHIDILDRGAFQCQALIDRFLERHGL